MISLQGDSQVPAIHIKGDHPAKTFEGSHLLNVFTGQLILSVWKGRMPETLPDIWKGASQTLYTALIYDIHQSITHTQTNH